MKKYKARYTWRKSQFENTWFEGKPITIEAKNLRSAEMKAEKKGTIYSRFEIIEEIKEK